jgi:hypothetical protein
VVGVATGTTALGALLALPDEVLVLVASSGHLLRYLRQTCCRLGRTAWATLCRRAGGVGKVLMPSLTPLFGLGHGLCGSPLFDSHRR